MAFDAGGALLSASAVAKRVRDRGPHFHVFSPSATGANDSASPPAGPRFVLRPPTILADGGCCVPVPGANGVPIPTTPPNQAPPHPGAAPADSVPRRAAPGPAPGVAPTPTSAADINQIRALNRAVHSEWLKGRGSAWVLGVPDIAFLADHGAFQLGPDCISESGLAAALDTLEDAALDECLSRHIAEGGDDRLHLVTPAPIPPPNTGRRPPTSASSTSSKPVNTLNPDPPHPEEKPLHVNKYYCPPRPVPGTYIMRSSCTCSPPSPDGYEAARCLLRSLWQGRVSYERAFRDTRADISRLLGLHTPHEVVLHPSGSDAELIPLVVAAARADRLSCDNIANIVVAAGEVGSGTAPAAGGRHFSKFAPCGAIVESGKTVEGFPTSTQVVEVKPRTSGGDRAPDYDLLVIDAVNEAEVKATSHGTKTFFIVHAVDGSKTGLRVPSKRCLSALKTRLGDRFLVVLDACQCRSEAEEIDWFLTNGALVLVTSSKFYGAPGFCGAVLLPRDACRDLETLRSPPPGLKDYLTQYEVPNTLTSLHNAMPSGPKNIGLLLRWACGIAEMELFSQQGRAAKDAMRDWVHGVRALVMKRRPYMDLIDLEYDEQDANSGADQTRYGGVNSIVSIKFLSSCGTRHLDADMLRNVHRWLTIDCSSLLPASATNQERAVASRQCFVGQPVKLGRYGVLRLAIGAVLAREIAATRSGLATALADDDRVLDKMLILAKYCAEMH